MKPTLLHLIGNTGVGKTTLMQTIQATYKDVHCFSVGKILRSRYTPDHFQGQAAPDSTEAEALEIYQEQIRDAMFQNDDLRLVVIDGQPRKASQVRYVHAQFPELQREYMVMHLDHEERKLRLTRRDAFDEAALALSMQRLNNDYRNTYEVMIELARKQLPVTIVDVQATSAGGILYNLGKQYGLEVNAD